MCGFVPNDSDNRYTNMHFAVLMIATINPAARPLHLQPAQPGVSGCPLQKLQLSGGLH